ncbi:hypothetical protein QEG73_13300 [Chitinophagaceae bacterium 26-R-25]|nr:hypothetical protein [Chitinophagaceae bacterium 26-R-25]
MNNAFVTFQRFNDPELANATAEKLKENNIEALIENGRQFFNPNFANNAVEADIELKLKQSDFARAEKIIESLYNESIDNVDKDYYLFEFTTAELKEIISKPDEWGKFDYQLAQKLLKERGVDLSEAKISSLKEQRTKQLAEPESVSSNWIIAGYILPFIFGFPGIVFGWIIAYSKKSLPDGQKVFIYNNKARAHGRRIFRISLIVVGLTLLGKFIYGGNIYNLFHVLW